MFFFQANARLSPNGGKLLIPLGTLYCELKLIEKQDNETHMTDYGGCVFVPLVGKYGH